MGSRALIDAQLIRHPGGDLGWLERAGQRIASTAAEAVRAMQPARLELACDDHPLLGSLQGVDRPPVVKDPFLFVMRLVARSTGQTIATVVNWSDHPEVFGRRNTQITSDYPHWVRAYLEKRFGGTALFFGGSIGKLSPLGDQVSLLDPGTGKIAEDGTWRKAELLGTEIGRLAERALKSAEPINLDSLSIQTEIVFVPMHNSHFRAAEAVGVFAGRKPLYTNGQLDPATEERDLPDVGRVKYPTGRQFILGLGNDEIGYLIPKAEWDEEPPWLMNAAKPWYGEINSSGPDAAGAILRALVALIRP